MIWSVTATMEIEAESLEDAILKAGKPTAPRRCPAEDGRLSTTPDYLDGSFEVDMTLLERHAACEGLRARGGRAVLVEEEVWLPPRRAILLRSKSGKDIGQILADLRT